jgi:hypothetical protein
MLFLTKVLMGLITQLTHGRGSAFSISGRGPVHHYSYFIIILYFNYTVLYLSYIAYDSPGQNSGHLPVFYLCSRIGLLPYNPTRRPAFIKAQRLLGSLPSYWFSRVAVTASPHLLLSHTPMSVS